MRSKVLLLKVGALTFFVLNGCASVPVSRENAVQPQKCGITNNQWVRPDDKSSTAIVFVHGIFSNSEECWKSSNGVCWPYLLRDEDHKFDGTAIYAAGYATKVSQQDYGLRDAAKEVFESLERDGVIKKQNILFICHSTGGIVVRYLLTESQWADYFKGKTIGLALYASPSRGSRLADYVRGVAKLLHQDLGATLSTESELLNDLHERFSAFEDSRKNIDLVGQEICETANVVIVRVVSCESANPYFGNVRRLAGKNHFETVKPNSVDDSPNEVLEEFYEKKFKPLVERLDSVSPKISAIAPTEGSVVGGYSILVTGADFRPGLKADLEGVELPMQKLSPAYFSSVIPPSTKAGAVTLHLHNPLSTSTSTSFTYKATLEGVAPSAISARGGETVTLHGAGLAPDARVEICEESVSFDDIQPSAQGLVVKVPPLSSGLCDVTVEMGASGTVQLKQALRVNPVIAGVKPSVIDVESPSIISISGLGFTPGMRVKVGAAEGGVRYDTANLLTVSLPPFVMTGALDVAVIGPDNSHAALSKSIAVVPLVSSVTPSSGPISGGNVKINGKGFGKNVVVFFGSSNIQAVSQGGDTIYVSVPTQAQGGRVDVRVENSDNTAGVCGGCYEFVASEVGVNPAIPVHPY